MKTVALVQARMGSTRLPKKVLRLVDNKPMIQVLLSRLSKSKELDEIVVATSKSPQNNELQTVVESLGFKCTRGSEEDVLDRYFNSAKMMNADIIVRITGDCPLIDPFLVDECIRGLKKFKVDYYSNTNPVSFPDGLDVEVMTFQSLERANSETNSKYDREHVTPYIINSDSFLKSSLKHSEDFSHLRWTVDEIEDLKVVNNVFKHFSPNLDFNWKQVLKLQKNNPRLFSENKNIKNNEGAYLGKGQKLYKRAKQIIPGGNMLLSKRPEMYLPDRWPAYFSKSKGCKVWDLDGNAFIDMSVMGVGTNILGYSNTEIDEAVIKTVKDGNMSTLNCPEEVYLAEKLIELHPWADMVRYARSGGEANSIAVRIARASTGRDKIAVCGYHGWHDWYLSSNLSNDKNLDGHLLPGLEPTGVPRGLIGTTLPFDYGNIKLLEKIIKENKNQIAAIKMEVSRNDQPKNNFLQYVRDVATRNNIILIFDECTSGFRETFGGLHKKYDVEPDIAIFGKALGNGYAITAVLGKHEIMQAAQKTFISSTFWTERIGPTAALKTLEIMQREKSWEIISRKGKLVSSKWKSFSKKYDIKINLEGLSALPSFSFNSKNNLAYKTLLTQEMLAKGYLALPTIYLSTAHTDNILENYFKAIEPVFSLIQECEEGRDVFSLLKGPICHSGFKRLN